MIIRASIAIFSIFFAQATLTAQATPALRLSRADTLEILIEVARETWGRSRDTSELFPSDEITRKAMRAILVSLGADIHPVRSRGSTNCPTRIVDPGMPTGWIVELRVVELKGEALATVETSCGRGWENGFAMGTIYKMRRVKNRWVVGETFGAFIT